ncbi:MAG TPA: NAD(P)-dependent oxidoreductase [Gaiellaceae bacterium]|nr:NAD(P)-dependent oxidoreductase [Gaiellaceae bacterium]
MRFVCPDGEPQYRPLLDPALLGRLEAEGHGLVWHDEAPDTTQGWIDRLREAEGVLLLWRLPPGVIPASPKLRVISFVGTGIESYVEVDEARAAGVTLTNVPQYGANAVAEHAVALLFAVARRVVERDRAVRGGSWAQDEGVELRGRRLGVVGAGPTGMRMIELGRALGMTVTCWTRRRTAERERELGVPLVELDDLFASSDVVSLHLAATPETEGIVDRRLLGLLPRGAIVVNTARGTLVDEQALAELLEAGAVGGAGLDVLAAEPPPPDHPLLSAPRVVVTPHVAFHTAEASRELLRISLENLLAFARGAPQNVR